MITFQLLKVLLKNFEMISFEKQKSRKFFLTMALVTVLVIMIPAALMIGFISYGMTITLLDNNGDIEGVKLLLFGISIFSFIFCINVVLNVFYFSSDIEYLIPLPLKPTQIIGAKFVCALINESAMQFVLVLSSLIGFMIAIKANFFSCIYTIIGVITFPIIPLVYCGIICLLMMRFFRFIKNKDFVNKLSGIIIGLIVVGSILLLTFASTIDIENFTINLKTSSFMAVLNVIFPHVDFLTKAINETSFLSFIIYLLINILALLVFLILSKFCYFKGLLGLNIINKKKEKKLKFKTKTPFNSYLNKEAKILFKTPGFFINCVIINYIWPLFIYLLITLLHKSGNLEAIMTKYRDGNQKIAVLFIIAVIVSSILITGINSIASSSISREGKQFFIMKLLPLNYKSQLNAKALCSILITFSGTLIYLLAFGIYFDIGILKLLIYLALSLLSITFISYFGLYLDTINPKLVWDEEMNALRGNHTVFINMSLAIILTGILILTIYGLYYLKFPIVITSFVLLIGLSFMSFTLCMKKGPKNLEKI